VAPEQMLHHIRSRRSTRIYKDKPIPREIIEQVIKAGRYAPTGGNFQSIYLTIVADRLKQENLREKLLACLKSQVEMSESWLKRLKKKGELLSNSEKHTIALWSGFRRDPLYAHIFITTLFEYPKPPVFDCGTQCEN
jgi:nitroreductase